MKIAALFRVFFFSATAPLRCMHRTVITRHKGDGEALLFLMQDSGVRFDKIEIGPLEKGT